MYDVLRPLLFRLSAEKAHNVTLRGLDLAAALGLHGLIQKPLPPCPVTVMGIEFPNPVGLAAGLDKNANHLKGLAAMGFGSLEVGTVTPLAQPGNPQPRLFRVAEHRAIINRMGFNNRGLEYLTAQVAKSGYQGVLGINVGKNKDTAAEDAESDYRKGIAAVYAQAHYITVNVSSPNTPGLRDLQFGDSLKSLLAAIKDEQGIQSRKTGRYVPIAVKIAPDMSDDEITFVAAALKEAGIDGVIATNTTISREAIVGHPLADEAGGLSGAPVAGQSLRVIRGLRAELGESMPIIGVGGILTGEDAIAKLKAGASLVQVYSGLIYRGPALVRECVEATSRYLADRQR